MTYTVQVNPQEISKKARDIIQANPQLFVYSDTATAGTAQIMDEDGKTIFLDSSESVSLYLKLSNLVVQYVESTQPRYEIQVDPTKLTKLATAIVLRNPGVFTMTPETEPGKIIIMKLVPGALPAIAFATDTTDVGSIQRKIMELQRR